MQKYITLIILITFFAVFMVPDPWIGEYEGVRKAKYFLRDATSSAIHIVLTLAKGQRPSEFDTIEERAKEEAEQKKEEIKEEIKEEAKKTLNEAIDEL